MALTEEQITAKNFQKFYNLILPYLNSAPGCTPIGTVIAVMGNSAPAYYLKCDGTIYNIADYSDLANYFEIQFGSSNYFGGDGTTTFAVPDLRGEFLRGTGTNSHETTYAGETIKQGDGGDVGEHQNATVHVSVYTTEGNIIARKQNSTTGLNVSLPDSNVSSGTYAKVATTNGTSTHIAGYTSRPTNTSVLYCIAYKNIYVESSGGGGSDVTVTPIITSGEKIAIIGVDGVDNDLYAPLPKEYDSGDGIDITNDIISVDEMSSEDMSEIINPLPSTMSRRMKYSTEEQVIGEWIDGKPVYQRTIQCTTPSTAGSSVEIYDLSDFNIDTVVSLEGSMMMIVAGQANSSFSLNYYISSTNYCSCWVRGTSNTLAMRIGGADYANLPVYITMKYTKLSDSV